MKNKGITLISLVITIIILGIIGTVTIYTGINTITAAKLKRFTAEMEIIRLKCNELLEEGITIEELLARGQDIAILSSNKLEKINNVLQKVTNSTNTEGYVYFNSLGLQNLGIASVNREVIINFNDKVIIDINGVKDENDEYIYTIEWTSNAVLAINEKVQSIALDNTSYTLTIGKIFTLTPIITPSNANNKKVTWSSSDESVATVASNGVVTGISKGTATITATTQDGGKVASCVVTVVDEPKVTLSATTGEIEAEKTLVLTATLNVEATQDIVWSSSDNTIATVEGSGTNNSTGTITGIKEGGPVTITATYGDKTATCSVTVTPAMISFIIEGVNYSCEKYNNGELTDWEYWCNSPHNTIGAVIDEELRICVNGNIMSLNIPTMGGYAWVYSNNTLLEGREYSLENPDVPPPY